MRTQLPRVVVPAALVFAALLVPSAASQTASALLVEDGDLPGAPAGHTVDSLSNTAVNHVGGYACSVNSSDGSETLSHVWGNASGGPGTVLRTEGTIGNLIQTSFESFYGLSDSGQVAYSATTENTDTGSTGLDGVWLDDTVIANEEEAVPSIIGQFWSFGSRPGVTRDGIPYWVGGITDTQGGSTQNRGLFLSAGATPLILGFDNLPGLPFPIDDSNGVSFDYRFSAEGNAFIAEVQMEAGSTSADGAMVLNGAGLEIGGGLVREGDPVPASVGGLVDENWDNFDFAGVTESGKWFFTGDTDADSDVDEIVVVNGQILYREGDVIDGEIVDGSIEGAFMNEQGDLAFIWDIDGGSLEALFFNGQLLLAEGDEVDLDGDGVIDAGAVISSFTGISSLTVGDRDEFGFVNIYFTADVDTEGTSSTSDDVEGFFCMNVQGAECFLVLGDGPGLSVFNPGQYPFTTLVDDVDSFYAVTLDDIPEFLLPAPTTAGTGLTGGALNKTVDGTLARLGEPLRFAAQVVMWNPYVFPDQAEQFTQGVLVEAWPTGEVSVRSFGSGTGMQVWAEVVENDQGQKVLRLPFSIPGI